MIKMIQTLIKFAIYAGLSGGLVDLTKAIAFDAAQAHSHGLISLKALNKQLMGP